MRKRTASDDYEPVIWIGGRPLYSSTLLLFAHVFAMVTCAIFLAAGKGLALLPLVFDSDAVVHDLRLWQLGSYAFLHIPDSGQYYLWFALEMFFLFTFGREVERYLGRRAFLTLYALLLFLPALVLTALGPLLPSRHAGSGAIHLAVFVAFAALYPSAEMLFSIRAKWLAALLTAAAVMQAGVFHDWISLLVLCISASTALVFVGYQRSADWLDFRNYFSRRNPAAVATRARTLPPRLTPPPAEMGGEIEDPVESIDALLDKIAAHGLESLTKEERATLEKARQALLKKG